MSNPRIHLGTAGAANPMNVGLCGIPASGEARLTEIDLSVTCRKCATLIGRAIKGDKTARSQVIWAAPGSACGKAFIAARADAEAREAAKAGAASGPLSLPYLGRGKSQITDRERRQIERERRGETLEQWPTLGSALKAWARPVVRDDGLRSGSDFSRDRVQGGDGPRIPNEHAYTAQAIDKAIAAACADEYRIGGDGAGRVHLDAEDCHALIRGFVVDKLSEAQVADDLNESERRIELGRYRVTPVQARRARGELLRRAGAWLYSRGFLEHEPRVVDPSRARAYHKRQTAGNEGATVALPPGFDVDGWKGIAAEVGFSESYCRSLARLPEKPLPVSEFRGRVVAKASELRAWMAHQVKPKGASAA